MNRLINEKSPYLRQHASNPVDWFAWSDEAFEIAKSQNKPIFLSIGYSTCHWCHVMEHESFSDPEVAAMMNESFINIKLDREERPDIDSVYMSVCQMLTGSGGWPLTVMLTPDKKPFFAGTYFPKESKYGRIGMIELIRRVNEAWTNQGDMVMGSAEEITTKIFTENNKFIDLQSDISDYCFDMFAGNFDEENGGFGNAPKFPSPHNLEFLLNYGIRKNSPRAVHFCEKTLLKMSFGGIFDHLGYGFHRYSTDKVWLVPHFEKMLYDQALIGDIYMKAYLTTKNKLLLKTASEILDYVSTYMMSPEGAFYSAEDADSEGTEGKFYVWTKSEIKEILGLEQSEIFCDIYQLRDSGNFHDEIAGTANGNNILHLRQSIEDICLEKSLEPNDIYEFIQSGREKLINIRNKRIRPLRDEKVLTDWNSMMISTFALYGFHLDSQVHLNIAINAYNFLEEKMYGSDRSLMHRWMDGDAAYKGNLDDYSYFIRASIDLYIATANTKYLLNAINTTNYVNEKFLDAERGGYYFSPADSVDLIVRKKEIHDGAIPSGNSIMLNNLLKLSSITNDEKYKSIAEKCARYFSKDISTYPAGYSKFVSSLSMLFHSTTEIIIAGDEKDDNYSAMLDIIRKNYLPDSVIICNTSQMQEIVPELKNKTKIDNQTTVYICKNYSCRQPVNNPLALQQLFLENV